MSRAARVLVLAVSLVVALPHGWCCVVACQLTRIAAAAIPVKTRSCCACRNHTSPNHGDKRAPLPASRCPCYDRHTILPHAASADISPCDVAVVAVLPVCDALTAFIGVDRDAVCVVHPPTDSPHISQCVWRC